MLIEGTCKDVRVGPVVDVAVGADPESTYQSGAWLRVGLRAMFNRSMRQTAIREDLIHDLRLRQDENGMVRVCLLFREVEGRGMALFPDIQATKIDVFGDPRHKQMLAHSPEDDVGVLLGGDVLDLSDFLLLDDGSEGWGGRFVFSVDTGTGITPARMSG